MLLKKKVIGLYSNPVSIVILGFAIMCNVASVSLISHRRLLTNLGYAFFVLWMLNAVSTRSTYVQTYLAFLCTVAYLIVLHNLLTMIPTRSSAPVGGRKSVSVFFSSRRRHTRCSRDWSSDVCSSD